MQLLVKVQLAHSLRWCWRHNFASRLLAADHIILAVSTLQCSSLALAAFCQSAVCPEIEWGCVGWGGQAAVPVHNVQLERTQLRQVLLQAFFFIMQACLHCASPKRMGEQMIVAIFFKNDSNQCIVGEYHKILM